MAGVMVAAAVVSALLLPRLGETNAAAAKTDARHDLIGFFALLAAVAVGALLTDRAITPLARALLPGAQAAQPTCWRCSPASPSRCRWPPSPRARASRRCCRAWRTILRNPAGLPAFIVLYKLGDAFAGSLMTPFLLKSMAYAPAEVGVVSKDDRPVAHHRRRWSAAR